MKTLGRGKVPALCSGDSEVLPQLERVQSIVCDVGQIAAIGPDEDFYEKGFSSLRAMELLLELETTCAVSVPDDKFIAARTPRALHALILKLQHGS